MQASTRAISITTFLQARHEASSTLRRGEEFA